MITLNDAREIYYESTGTASKLIKELSLVGLIMVGYFKVCDTAMYRQNESMMKAICVFFIMSLMLHLIQYVYKAIAWACIQHINFKHGIKDDEEIHVGEWVNYIALICFYFKSSFLIAGYICMMIAILR